jgi:outer membrane protein assembly factor BamB
VLDADKNLTAVEPSGRIRSRTSLDVELPTPASIAVGRDGAVRVATMANTIVCVGPTGTERWRAAIRGGVVSALSIDDADALLAIEAGQEHALIAVDARGRLMWRVALDSRARAAPVLGPDGTIYVATGAGALMALSGRR